MVVMMPMNKFAQASVTNAELGMEKTKLAGYINGTEAQLQVFCKSKLFS